MNKKTKKYVKQLKKLSDKKFQEMPTEETIKQLLEILAGKFGGNGHE